MSSKRIIKHQNAKGRTLYGLILTPGELRLFRGFLAQLNHNELEPHSQKEHLNLWDAVARETKSMGGAVAFSTNQRLVLKDESLLATLTQEAKENLFEEET
jgi:hypothetical protein